MATLRDLPDSAVIPPRLAAPRWLARLFQAVPAGPRPGAFGPIGIDFARDRVHLAQIHRSTGVPQLHAAVSLAYPDGRAAVLADPRKAQALLRRARASAPFVGKQVVGSLPGDVVRLMLLNFTLGESRDATSAIVRELRERLKEQLDGNVLDYLLIRSADALESQARSAIVALAPRDRVTAHLDMLSGAGLQVQALDIAPAALCRLVSSGRATGDISNALLITFGRERSFFTVLWGKRLMLDRSIDFGEATLAGRVAKALDISDRDAAGLLEGGRAMGGETGDDVEPQELAAALDEIVAPAFARLADEINRTIVYVASQTRGAAIERVVLVGGAARYPRIVEWLHRRVSIPVGVLDPLTALGGTPALHVGGEHDAPVGIAVAAGLALRQPTRSGP